MSIFLDCSSLKYWWLGVIQTNQKKIILRYKKSSTSPDELITKLLAIFTKHNFKVIDVEKIYLVNGPGSFTGTRCALTFAKTWKVLQPKTEIFVTNSFILNAIANEYSTKIVKIGLTKKTYAQAKFNGQKISSISVKNGQNYLDAYDSLTFKQQWSNIAAHFKRINKLSLLKPMQL